MSLSNIDHKALVASLSDEERLRLTAKSDGAGLKMLASHIFGLLGTGIWIQYGGLGWQFALVFHGIQLVFLFTLLHETVHDTPFASPFLNSIVGWICGLVIFLPPIYFRYFHLAHHRHTHDPDKDPELLGPPIQSRLRYFWVITGIPVWLNHLGTIFTNAGGKGDYEFLPKSAAKRVKQEAQVMLVLYALVLFGSIAAGTPTVLFLWIIPIVLGQPFLRLYLMAEHGRCPHVANMLENTRTTFTNRLVRWLAWNMSYHAEHHAYPSVPFHLLPKFHQVTREHLLATENGYRRFHEKLYSELADQ